MEANSEKWILQLCHGYSPPFDDVARQWRSLFDGLKDNVLTVFLTGSPDEDVKKLVGGNVEFLGFKSKDLRGLKRKQIRAIKALHQQYQFQFAIAHRYKSIYIASHLPGIDVIGVSHAYGVYDRFWRNRYVMKHSDRLKLAGVSDAIRDDARQALPGFPKDSIQTVYNHVDVKRLKDGLFSREEARDRLGLSTSDFVVGNVGRLHPDKDQSTLIKAFAAAMPEMTDARLVILGEGRLRSALEQEIKDLEIDAGVELMGRVPEAYRYFSAFDVFVLSSDYEPFGMVLLEAMVAGVSVISSSCGGAPEVLGEAGIFFPVSDERVLSMRMVDAFREGEHARKARTENLQERLQHVFSDEAVRKSFSLLREQWGLSD